MVIPLHEVEDMVSRGRCPHVDRLPIYDIRELSGVGEYIFQIGDELALCGKPAFWGPGRGMNTEYCREHYKAR